MNNREAAEVIVKKAAAKGLRISSAESITGGMFAAAMTDIPGSSAVFDRGLVTYSNEAKISELDVAPETIEGCGAISSQTAREMVEGLRIYSGSDLCISVTGNAGPDPAEGKPVGLYYIGFYFNGETSVYEIDSAFSTRAEIREEACGAMLKIILNAIGN